MPVQHTANERADERDTARPHRVRRSVLVIDDEPLIGTTLRILLDEYEVTVALSGRQAQQVLGSGARFDAILCDLSLEDLSGIEIAAWIRSARPELAERVIYMTGGAYTDEARDFLRSLPNTRRLEKPFSAEQIHRALEAV